MKYTDYLLLSRKEKLIYNGRSFLARLGHGFINFFINIYYGFIHFFKRLGCSFKEVGYAFSHGDIFTKLSFVFLGTSNIARKQYIKGISIFLIEIIFIAYLVLSGGTAIAGLITLGNHDTYYTCNMAPDIKFPTSSSASIFCQETYGSDVITSFVGDVSSNMLLFGIAAVIILIGFVFFYLSIIKQSIKVQEMEEEGHKISSFLDDIKEYLDGKFYRVLLFLPIIGICIFTILPLVDMMLMAFTNYDRLHQAPVLFDWVGFQNFYTLFSFGDGSTFGQTFWNILGWTVVWAVLATFSNYIMGMIVAMLINKKSIRCKKVFRSCLVLAIAIPSFISLLAFSKFLGDEGIINLIFRDIGLIGPRDSVRFLSVPLNARITVVLVNLWSGIPYTMLITSGILMNIPADLYESAKIDGASPVKMYAKITLPYVLFVTGPYLITQFIGNINNFNIIFFLTGGGPMASDYYGGAGKTDLLVTWLYKLTVNQNDYSLASVIGIMTFAVSAIVSLIFYRHSSNFTREEEFA